MKLVITSNGDLCTGLVSSLNMIAGENKDVFTVKLTDAGIGEYTKNLHSLLDELIKEDSVLILADLQGGTPYKVWRNRDGCNSIYSSIFSRFILLSRCH